MVPNNWINNYDFDELPQQRVEKRKRNANGTIGEVLTGYFHVNVRQDNRDGQEQMYDKNKEREKMNKQFERSQRCQ